MLCVQNKTRLGTSGSRGRACSHDAAKHRMPITDKSEKQPTHHEDLKEGIHASSLAGASSPCRLIVEPPDWPQVSRALDVQALCYRFLVQGSKERRWKHDYKPLVRFPWTYGQVETWLKKMNFRRCQSVFLWLAAGFRDAGVDGSKFHKAKLPAFGSSGDKAGASDNQEVSTRGLKLRRFPRQWQKNLRSRKAHLRA